MKNIGQVWVENAIYILIGITLISIILALAFPQIEKMKDEGIIKQTIIALNNIDSTIQEIQSKPVGNSRKIDIEISKGKLIINSEEDSLVYVLENTRFEKSQVGEKVPEGDFTILTEKNGARYNIKISKKYNSMNITFKGKDKIATLNAGATPYQILIENSPTTSDKPKINFELLN